MLYVPNLIKVCCVSSIEEAQLAIKFGATAIGLVGHMPSGPGVIDDNLIASIARVIPSDIQSFLLTSETEPDKIFEHYKRTKTTTIQLVDRVSLDSYAVLRNMMPSVKLVQVIHVLDQGSIEQAISVQEYVDYVLLDSGRPQEEVKILGGTGQTHNWTLSRAIVEQLKIPVILAGGLQASNIQQAIDTVKPFGVDLCSKVRTDGYLDKTKLKLFFDALSQ